MWLIELWVGRGKEKRRAKFEMNPPLIRSSDKQHVLGHKPSREVCLFLFGKNGPSQRRHKANGPFGLVVIDGTGEVGTLQSAAR